MPQPLRILQVEDNPDDAQLELRELKRAGFEVIPKRVDTEPAFLQNLNGECDLILSDFAMPEFDGMRALDLLKKSGLDIPFVLVSGTIGEDLAVEAMKQGATDYLLKDRLVRLGPAVRQALERGRLRKERHEGRKALRESEGKFRQLAENINEVLWVASADSSQLLYISPSYEVVWGRTRQSLYEQPVSFLEAVHEEDRGRLIAALEKLQSGEKLDLEYRVARPDGQIRWIHARGTAVRNEAGDIYRIVGIAEDITERRRAEEGLRSSEARLNFALQTSQTGAWELSLRDHTAKRTAIHDRIFGYDAMLPQWTYEMFLEHILPEDRAEVERSFRDAIATRATWNFECRIRRPDSAVRWIWAAGGHELDSMNNVVRMSGIVQDITARKRVEEETKAQLRELQRWHEAMLGREDRVLELKREVNELLAQQGRPARYANSPTP